MGTSTPATRTPTPAEAVQAAIDQTLDHVYTAIPGTIVTWDPTQQLADVKPSIMRRIACEDGSEIAESLPVIPHVPVALPRGGGPQAFFMSFPLQVGDPVVVVFSQASLDVWMQGIGQTGSPGAPPVGPYDTDPNDFRRHDITDAIAFLGGAPVTRALREVDPLAAVFGQDGGTQLRVPPTGIAEVGSTTDALDFAALSTLVKNEITALRNTVNSLVTAYNTHVHVLTLSSGTGTAAPTVTTGTAPAAVGNVAATKLKTV